ncbi:hypothetical protein MAR_036881 [Mya arenaria]|uniref:VWFA domain-containing protein n=1 Tax=Mya arenaria TaxID=6604 RepID=A0ABY7FM49_MYAAR|nr:hypothetical protein MAR_036881 [Mya arenaria]
MSTVNSAGRRASIQSTAKPNATDFMVKNMLKGGRDLLIILDGSGSIGATNFHDTKNQLARLLGMLCPTSDPFKVKLSENMFLRRRGFSSRIV